jgi:hypothetical protein
LSHRVPQNGVDPAGGISFSARYPGDGTFLRFETRGVNTPRESDSIATSWIGHSCIGT